MIYLVLFFKTIQCNVTQLDSLIGYTYLIWTTCCEPVARPRTPRDATELRFEIWISQETVRDRRELVANPRTPRDATAQFSSIASLGLRRALQYWHIYYVHLIILTSRDDINLYSFHKLFLYLGQISLGIQGKVRENIFNEKVWEKSGKLMKT